MKDSYEVNFEKDNSYSDPTSYHIDIETKDFSCYQTLKALIIAEINKRETLDSMIFEETGGRCVENSTL